MPLGEVLLLLPELEELEDLKLGLVAAAAPDPQREWMKSAAHATTDKRLLDRAAMTEALEQAEAAMHSRVAVLFSGYGRIFQAFCEASPAECVRELVELGELEEGRARFERAQMLFSAALRLSLPLPDKSLQSLTLRRLGRVLRSRGDLKEALAHYQRSAELANDSGDLLGEISARIGLGTVLGYQGRWQDAEAAFQAALTLIERSDADLTVARGQVYNNLAAAETRQNRLAEAEVWFDRAMEVWDETESPADLAVCYHNMAVSLKRQGRVEESTEMYHRALGQELPATFRALIATDLAQSYAEQGMHGQAREWVEEAEVQAAAARSPYSLGYLNYGLGEIARATDDEDGFIFYERALEIARNRGLTLLEGQTLLGYGLLRKNMGEADEARALLAEAVKIFRTTGMAHERERAQGALAEISTAAAEVIADSTT